MHNAAAAVTFVYAFAHVILYFCNAFYTADKMDERKAHLLSEEESTLWQYW